MNFEDVVLLAVLIFMLGVWLGVSLTGYKPYSQKGLRTPLQSSVPSMPKRNK